MSMDCSRPLNREINMSISNIELKLTVARLIEAAYSTNKGLTARIIRESGPFKIAVDQQGNASLSGKLGVINFSGSEVINSLGVNIKFININLSSKNSRITYSAIVDIKSAKLAVTGDFDPEKLITSCSGLLCAAAKSLQGREQAYDAELKKIMGY